MTAERREASLKLVVVTSIGRPLGDIISDTLESALGVSDRRAIGDRALVVHTEASTAEIRDALAGALDDGESVFVCEFERWSSWEDGVDAVWLARRGH